ncbi:MULTISPECIES: hypothetical protein [unclassified Streptomyces]
MVDFLPARIPEAEQPAEQVAAPGEIGSRFEECLPSAALRAHR